MKKTYTDTLSSAYPSIASVVPFRRGKQYAAYHIFLKRLSGLVSSLQALEPSIEDMEDDIWTYGGPMSPVVHMYGSKDLIKSVQREIRGKTDKHEADWDKGYFFELQGVRESIDYYLKDFQRSFVVPPEFSSMGDEDLAPKDLKTLRTYVSLLNQLKDLVDGLRLRIAREKEVSSRDTIPSGAQFEETETLYHASVHARDLYRKGFSPKGTSTGLGGSNRLRGGKEGGISFTEDEYVAKEIAKTFKEIALVAQGALTSKHLQDWIRRKPARVQDRIKEMMHQMYRRAAPGPEHAMGLYLCYLKHSDRYDPVFFGQGPKGLVMRFSRLSVRDIGYIHAEVSMSHPDILYLRGEREVRVPVESVKRVTKFV